MLAVVSSDADQVRTLSARRIFLPRKEPNAIFFIRCKGEGIVVSVKTIKPPVKSTFIVNHYQAQDTYRYPELLVGWRGGHEYRALLQFDLRRLPETAMVQSAFLQLYLTDGHTNANEKQVAVYQVASRWNEKRVRWSTQPLVVETPVAQMRVCGECQSSVAGDITEMVCAWRTNRSANLGLMLALAEDCERGCVRFIGGRGVNALCWPYLAITCKDDAPGACCPTECARSLDVAFCVAADTQPQHTQPLETLSYNYAYHVINSGDATASVYLQTSADGVHWLTESGTYTIAPQACAALVSNTSARYSHLCYQSADKTELAIYVQGTRL